MLLPTPALWAATRTRLCLAANLLLPCLWCSGALLLDESFEYPNGPLAMASEGLWFNTSGTPTNTLGIVNERALLEESDAEDLASLIPGGPFNSSTNVILYWRFRLTQTRVGK